MTQFWALRWGIDGSFVIRARGSAMGCGTRSCVYFETLYVNAEQKACMFVWEKNDPFGKHIFALRMRHCASMNVCVIIVSVLGYSLVHWLIRSHRSFVGKRFIV